MSLVAHIENYEMADKGKPNKLKDELKLPSSRQRHVSLSDIIAATIGEEARSCDILYNDVEETAYTEMAKETCFTSSNPNFAPKDNQILSTLTSENSNNACDLFDNGFDTQQDNTINTDFFKDILFSGIENEENEVAATIGFDTEMNFLSSLFTPEGHTEPGGISKQQITEVIPKTEISNSENGNFSQVADTSYDSDLEDSMHFVEPDQESIPNSADDNLEPQEPVSKKQRVSLYDSSSCPFPISGNQDFLGVFNNDFPEPAFKMNNITRTRSFSGNIKPKMSRQSGKCNLLNQSSNKTPNFGRARSFSEACYREDLSPLGDSSFNTSLSSLFESPESSPLSNNPFFSDLKSLLISDCNQTNCPKTLFETLSNKQKQDVYARERNLQSKFSSLQGKYPDEVRDLSSFYRQQSAEVETERLKEIHDENVPISYRNHLNSYYDNQLHMIMERVEKSLSLLLIAKREIVSINRPFKSRPLLSRKAVKMMEEWYSRNFEHPYPGPTAVEALANAGEITNEQVKKWFANKRNRCKNTKPVPEIANMKRKRQFSSRW